MTFAEKLLFVRAELNISQTQLAEQLGVAFTTINRWENSKVKPTSIMYPIRWTQQEKGIA